MNKRILIASLFAIMFLGFSTAFAQTVKEPSTGVDFPATVNVGGANLAITGTGVRKKFGFKVYAIASYMEAGKINKGADLYTQLLTDGPAKQIVMHFVRDVDAGRIKDTFKDGLEKNIPAYANSPARKDAEAFLNALTDVKSGQQIVLRWTQGGKVEVSVGGQGKGTFQNPIFARGLWGIWLGGSPVQSDIKANLIANVK